MDLAIFLFKSYLKRINTSVFKFMLDNNISLFQYFEGKMPSKGAVLDGMKMLGVDVEKINVNMILNCFAQANPDAYSLILKHPNGTSWLKKTLDDLKKEYTPSNI